jgi:hypothetical protein
VVDADRSIHPSNVGLSGSLDELLGKTRVGSLDDPPSVALLEARAKEVNGMLERELAPAIWRATQAVDAELTRFCEGLYPSLSAYRRRRRSA